MKRLTIHNLLYFYGMIIRKISKKVRTGMGILRREGILSFSIKTLQRFETTRRHKKSRTQKQKINLMVEHDDLLKADPRKPIKQPVITKKLNYTINWVMSPPGRGSGGHQNIYRFIEYLEKAGHRCRIYLYSSSDKRTVKEIKSAMGESYARISAPMQWLADDKTMEKADAVFATGWETAYPVYNAPIHSKKFYFVQDFEPYFFPVGTQHTLADNTYRFGLLGITAGGWLAKKLSSDYGMKTDYFDFSADKNLYKLTNKSHRKEVFFYARPVTARRGFEMGIAALEVFHKKHPDYTINLAGWDVSDYSLPFPFKNLKTLDLSELSDIYNRCAVALVISLTNMSLLPLELLACGTIPVVNDGENNRLVSDNPYIAYADNSPLALAEKMSETIRKPDLPSIANDASRSIGSSGWDKSGAKFISIVEKELQRG